MQRPINSQRTPARGALLAAFALLLALPALASGAEAGGVPWQREASPNVEAPQFPFDSLHSVFVASSNQAWAVGEDRPTSGEGFAALAEQWNGSKWTIVPTAELGVEKGASTPLNGVSGTGPSDVWAAGEARSSAGTTPVVEHWNGSHWSKATLPSVEGSLRAVSADGTSDAWAVGKTTTGSPLIEHFNGATWSVVPSAPGSGNQLIAVAALSPSNAWALGLFKPRRGIGNGVIEHWNGSEWSIVVTFASGTTLSSISAVSASNIWAVGSASGTQQLIEHWNGSEWSVAGPATPEGSGITGGRLTGVSALNASDVWAVGEGTKNKTEAGVEVSTNFELTEHWNGSKWTVVPSNSGPGAESVSGLLGGPLFAVGQTENRTFVLRQPVP